MTFCVSARRASQGRIPTIPICHVSFIHTCSCLLTLTLASSNNFSGFTLAVKTADPSSPRTFRTSWCSKNWPKPYASQVQAQTNNDDDICDMIEQKELTMSRDADEPENIQILNLGCLFAFSHYFGPRCLSK